MSVNRPDVYDAQRSITGGGSIVVARILVQTIPVQVRHQALNTQSQDGCKDSFCLCGSLAHYDSLLVHGG